MTTTLTAEWLKLTTTRAYAWILVGAAAVAALGTFSTISATDPMPWDLTEPIRDQTGWVLATINGGIFAIIVGARTFTDEFRHDTIAHTYIADPGRVRSTLGKAAAGALGGALVGVVVAATVAIVASGMALLSGGSIEVHIEDLGAAGGLVSAMALWATIGVGIGALIRNAVAVVAGALLWMLMLENLGAGLLEEAGRFLPGQAVHALARTPEAIGGLAAPPAAALMLGYAATSILAAVTLLRRRDIT